MSIGLLLATFSLIPSAMAAAAGNSASAAIPGANLVPPTPDLSTALQKLTGASSPVTIPANGFLLSSATIAKGSPLYGLPTTITNGTQISTIASALSSAFPGWNSSQLNCLAGAITGFQSQGQGLTSTVEAACASGLGWRLPSATNSTADQIFSTLQALGIQVQNNSTKNSFNGIYVNTSQAIGKGQLKPILEALGEPTYLVECLIRINTATEWDVPSFNYQGISNCVRISPGNLADTEIAGAFTSVAVKCLNTTAIWTPTSSSTLYHINDYSSSQSAKLQTCYQQAFGVQPAVAACLVQATTNPKSQGLFQSASLVACERPAQYANATSVPPTQTTSSSSGSGSSGSGSSGSGSSGCGSGGNIVGTIIGAANCTINAIGK